MNLVKSIVRSFIRSVYYLPVALISISVVAAAPAQDKTYRDPVNGQVVGVNLELSALNQVLTPHDVKKLGTEDAEQLARVAIKQYSQQLGLIDPDTDLVKLKAEADNLGITHLEFQQVQDQVPVFSARLSVHLNPAKNAASINGRVSQKRLSTVVPTISSEDAIKRAEEAWRRQYSTVPLFKSTPKLVILDTGLLEELNSGNIYLAYQIDLGVSNQSFRYFIDAATGVEVYKISLSTSATKRLVYDCSVGNGSCYLDTFSGFWGYTFGRSEGQPERGANPINMSLIQTYPNETDRLYSMLGAAYNYYGAAFNRNGANGVGGLGDGSAYPIDTIPAVSYADYKLPAIGCPNALFNQMLSSLEFCAGLMLVDTVGHEFTHAVIHYSADLIYQGQSGALNESIADIFGEAVERYALGSHDWLLGASSRIGTLRSMINPAEVFFNPTTGASSNGGQPDRFNSPLYQCGTADNGGVHTNSGVLNHAAYLIAAGGSFNGCSVTGLGDAKMEQIMYRALTRYLSSSSRFYDAYMAIRAAALDLYPLEDFLQVEKALRAVELPQAGYCSGISAEDAGCTALVDNCPNHPNQLDPGVCGCGFSSADLNRNGRADCLDVTAKTVPTAPVIVVDKTRAKITFQGIPGATYKVVLTSKGGRPRLISTKTNPYTVKLARGSWTVAYQVTVGKVTTKSSSKKSFKMK